MQLPAGFKGIPESVRDTDAQARTGVSDSLPMDFETAFEMLHDERRRAVVEVLRNDSPVSRRQLTDRLAARSVGAKEDSETGPPDPATRYRIRVALHHNHLPRLADAGLIEYDDETVAATPELDAFVEWVGSLDRNQETTEDRRIAEDSETTEDIRDRLMAFYA